MEKGNILEGVKGLIGSGQNNFSILEEEIDINLQFEYFKQAKKQRKARKKGEEPQEIDSKDLTLQFSELETRLYSEEISISDKKEILVELADVQDVKAFRIVEQYRNNAPEEMLHWSILALQESRMRLESSLLDENQVFISTGMGGKGNKLRYSVALKRIDETNFTETEHQVILRELQFALEDKEGEFENLRIEDEYAIAKVLIPMHEDINSFLKHTVQQCNQLGRFLQDGFVVTNVKEFTVEKLKAFEQKQEEKGGKFEIEIDGPANMPPEMNDIIESIKKVLDQKLNQIEEQKHDEDSEGDDNELDDTEGKPED